MDKEEALALVSLETGVACDLDSIKQLRDHITELHTENERLKQPDMRMVLGYEASRDEIARLEQRLQRYERDCEKCGGSGKTPTPHSEDIEMGLVVGMPEEEWEKAEAMEKERFKCPHCNGTGKVARMLIPDKFVKYIYRSISARHDDLTSDCVSWGTYGFKLTRCPDIPGMWEVR